ncbi:hypothetical protein FHS93_000436 [Sphingobium francense]|nr:hypothetical protein [Sphingobium indicum]
MALSAVAIKAAKGREKPYKLTDGDRPCGESRRSADDQSRSFIRECVML